MSKLLCFAGGIAFGVLLTCFACMQPAAAPIGTGYYPPGPPPGSHPEISQALGEIQHARYVLTREAANDYHGHKANAVNDLDSAISQLQICLSMP